MEKYKTIEEVFTYNFEVLRKWRSLICVPHRLPDAVRHFIAERLSNADQIAALQAERPEHRAGHILAFGDQTVLVLPNEIFQDEATYTQVVYGGAVLEQIEAIEADIDELARTREISSFARKAAEVVDSIELLTNKKSDFISATIVDLTDDLAAALAEGFRRSVNQKEFVYAWTKIIEHAHECCVSLKLSREVVDEYFPGQDLPY